MNSCPPVCYNFLLFLKLLFFYISDMLDLSVDQVSISSPDLMKKNCIESCQLISQNTSDDFFKVPDNDHFEIV